MLRRGAGRIVGFTKLPLPVTFARMTQTVSLPLWAFILIVMFAGVTFASHFLFPSVRWFFRKRAERVIARLNDRLQRPIEPFKLARRHDMIQRLIYDPEVTRAIVEHAKSQKVPENVAFETANRYAREIVPSFSATAYFGIGTRLARWLSKSLYDVKVGAFDRERLFAIDQDATVIFVMNHRSNMDYVLVTYLAANAGALSYAVGEWARVWPLSSVIRAMGAYFIRRRSRGALYRRVLARYVQMATRGGVSQAIFPEGRLSLTGAVAEPKLGLLNYIIEDYDPEVREVIFVPVALNYDRVLEDSFLINADKTGKRRFRPPVGTVLRALAHHFWLRLTGRFKGFGIASVSFGSPLELSRFLQEDRSAATEVVANQLMARIEAVIPVTPIPLVARALLAGATEKEALRVAVDDALAWLEARGIPRPDEAAHSLSEHACASLLGRGLIALEGDGYAVTDLGIDVLRYYAMTIVHHFEGDIADTEGNAAIAR